MSFVDVSDPTQERIALRYKYNSAEGGLILLENAHAVRSRKRCGKYYKTTSIDGRKYLEHRLVWILFNGPVPKGLVIDHIDRDRQNNRIENLRAVSWVKNTRNRKENKGRQLPIGVYNSGRATKPYVVRLCGGHFKTLKEAEAMANRIRAIVEDSVS